MDEQQSPTDLREGVRSGIVGVLQRDVEQRGWRTARLLIVAGTIGVAGALGATLLVTKHPFGHHEPWHVAAFSTVWAGLLVVTLAIALLQVRTPTLPLARSASIGLIGLGIAGVCGLACPDPHFLAWWSSTPFGAEITSSAGLALSALCFGLVTTLVFGTISALLAIGASSSVRIRPLLPAAMLALLLLPGVALQSVGNSVGVLTGWMTGTAIGAYVGVALGTRLSAAIRSP